MTMMAMTTLTNRSRNQERAAPAAERGFASAESPVVGLMVGSSISPKPDYNMRSVPVATERGLRSVPYYTCDGLPQASFAALATAREAGFCDLAALWESAGRMGSGGWSSGAGLLRDGS